MKKKTQASLGSTAVADATTPTVHAVTSLPWEQQGGVIRTADLPHGGILIADCSPVAVMNCRSAEACEANALLIVKAVNHHDSLVSWMRRELLDYEGQGHDGIEHDDSCVSCWRAAEARGLLRKIEDTQ